MKFSMEHEFPWPVEKIAALLASGEYLVPMNAMPNVTEFREIEKRRDGTKLYKKCAWCVHGRIPKIAQKIIRPDMLTFTENTVWDDESRTFSTRISPHFLRNQFVCRTSSRWLPSGNGGTKRIFQGEIEIKFPFIGPVVERTVIEQLKTNNDKNAVLVREALKEKLGPPGG